MSPSSRVVCSSIAILAITSTIRPAFATEYYQAKEYYGSTFFDDWTFYNYYDNLTNGDVNYVSAQEAAQDMLAYVDSSTSHAIIKVDNTTTVPWNDKRNSVRITTNDSFPVGTLWVADMYHVPYGCSVWPAWWSQAPAWPEGGEIDIFEGVNLQTQNQMSLHTETGCYQENPTQSSTLITSTNCSAANDEDQGCIVTDPSTSSYGSDFASAGGGAFVTEFASSGISIWFFDRSSIPTSLSSNASSIDTENFGEPVANWPNTGCDIEEYFQAQQLIFDITLCGDWAGNAAVFNATCSGVCYNDYVIGLPSNYNTAYFEVGYVRIFSNTTSDLNSSSGTSSNNSGVGTNAPSGLTSAIAFVAIVLTSIALLVSAPV